MAVTVYEVRNSTLKELYVGIDDGPFDSIKKKHSLLPPAPIAHWKYTRHQIVYAEIDHKLPDEDAKVFFESYAKMVYVPDWKTMKDPD